MESYDSGQVQANCSNAASQVNEKNKFYKTGFNKKHQYFLLTRLLNKDGGSCC